MKSSRLVLIIWKNTPLSCAHRSLGCSQEVGEIGGSNPSPRSTAFVLLRSIFGSQWGFYLPRPSLKHGNGDLQAKTNPDLRPRQAALLRILPVPQGRRSLLGGVPPQGNVNVARVQPFIHHHAPRGMAGFVLAIGSMSSNLSGEGDIRRTGPQPYPERTTPFSAN